MIACWGNAPIPHGTALKVPFDRIFNINIFTACPVLHGLPPNSRSGLYRSVSIYTTAGDSRKAKGRAGIAAKIAQKSAIYCSDQLPSNIDGSCLRH